MLPTLPTLNNSLTLAPTLGALKYRILLLLHSPPEFYFNSETRSSDGIDTTGLIELQIAKVSRIPMSSVAFSSFLLPLSVAIISAKP